MNGLIAVYTVGFGCLDLLVGDPTLHRHDRW